MNLSTVTPRPSVQSGIPLVPLSVAPSTIRVMRGVQWGLSSFLICAGLFTGWIWYEKRTVDEKATRYAAAAERTDALNQQLTAQLERNQLTLSASQMAAIQHEVRFVNQLAEKRGFLWTRLLSDLEEALPSGISVHKIHRDVKFSTVTIDGHATSMSTLQTLMTMLQARQAFHQPVLHHHQLVDAPQADGGGEREAMGVEFSVTVQYRVIGEKARKHAIS